MINCTFDSNTARVQGAAVIATASAPLVLASTFTRNRGVLHGGAIAAVSCPRLNLHRCNFTSNSAAVAGGALLASSSHVTANDTSLTSHTAATGGAIAAGLVPADELQMLGFFVLALSNCSGSNNSALSGSGGCIASDSVTVRISGGAWSGNGAAQGGGVVAATGGSLLLQGVGNMSANMAAGVGGGGAVSERAAPGGTSDRGGL